MARNEHLDSATDKILAALKADPAFLEPYDPPEIETLPISAIRNQLAELGLSASVPADLQRAIVRSSTVAASLMGLLDDEERTLPEDVENMPIAEVTIQLQRLGINYRAGLAQINDLIRQHALIDPPGKLVKVSSTIGGAVRPRIGAGELRGCLGFGILAAPPVALSEVLIYGGVLGHSNTIEVAGWLVCGMLLALRFQILVLAPAIILMLSVTLSAGAIDGASLGQIVLKVILNLIALEFGYFLSAASCHVRHQARAAVKLGLSWATKKMH